MLPRTHVYLPHSERSVYVHSQNMAGDVAISLRVTHIAHYEDAIEPAHHRKSFPLLITHTLGYTHKYTHTYIHSYKLYIHMYIYIHTYICTDLERMVVMRSMFSPTSFKSSYLPNIGLAAASTEALQLSTVVMPALATEIVCCSIAWT